VAAHSRTPRLPVRRGAGGAARPRDMLTRALREYAETPDRFASIAEGSSVTRYDDGRVCFIQGDEWGSVSSISIEADEGGPLVREVRRLARSRHYVWWIGPSSRAARLPVPVPARRLTGPSD